MRRLIIVLLLVGTALAQQSSSDKPGITIESIFSGDLTGAAPSTIKWSPDGQKVSYMLENEEDGSSQLYYIDVTTGKPAILVTSRKLATLAPPVTAIKDERERERRTRYSIAGYHWAPDSRHLLFDANGQLWYYTLQTGTAVALSASAEGAGDPKFSADGERLAYLREHNLYVRRVQGGRENALTGDRDDNILNGEVDWVYEEELDVRSNYFWSPKGDKIAFMQMNESRVPAYPITDFLPQHPTVSFQKYPKVGDPNPQVRIGVVNSSGGKPHWLKLTDENDFYIPRFGWLNDGVVWATILNRAQNKLDLVLADVNTGRSRTVLSETSDTWIETDDNFRIFKSKDKFIWSSWRDGFTHLYLYSLDKNDPLSADARLENQVTRGEFDVFSVEAIDEDAGAVYFVANPKDDRQRHLCVVKMDGGGFQVLTAGQPGSHEVSVSPDARYYIDSFSALITPPSLSFCQVGGGCSAFWRSKNIDGYKLTPPQFIDFKAEDGTLLRGLLYLPPEGSGKKIPVLMNPYGGPHGQEVLDHWLEPESLFFNQLLMADGIAVLVVDNRGTWGRGKKFAAALMHNFGEVELKDQLAALDQALSRFPQLDGSRLGWWGWSYGGYMTLNALTHSDRFKAGLAVAPVADWHDYDSIYAERYEGLVPANEAAYKKSSPVNFAAQLHGDLLEVHGVSDDNVHIQNTMQMMNNLIEAGKQFSLVLYPGKTHSIAGPAARIHLFTRIREYFRHELLIGETQ